MEETVTFEKVVRFDMTFEKFKQMFEFPTEEMYEEVWSQIVKRADKQKYGKFIYDCEIGYVEKPEPEVKKRGRKPTNESKKKELKTEIDLEKEEDQCFKVYDLVDGAVLDAINRAREQKD